MADGARNDVLGQKAQAAQRAYDARGMSMPKALRRALSRTADVLWDLALVTQNVTVEMRDQDEVVEGLGSRDLLVLLEGPEGAVGIAAIDRQVLTGVVEVQTIAQVTQMPVDEERIVTQTDAAMMSPLLDGALTRMAEMLADHPLHGQLEGFRFGAQIEDSRAVSLLLDAAAYRVFRAEVDLALGRRRGALQLVLPERKPRRTGSDAVQGPGPHEERLSRVPVRLSAVLSRLTLPLSRAEALKTGDLLALPPDALDKVEVTAGRGNLVARGRLGQLNGLRAVRLNWPVVGAAGMSAGARPAREGAEPDLDDFSGATAGAAAGKPEKAPAKLPALQAPAAAEPADTDLPDLPPVDFGADVAEFDFDSGDFPDGAEGGADDAQPMAALPDMDMGDGFAAAPLDFDFDEK
ncbi:FliM/FliN family flagellar motor switch protein [Antarctobacter jejuensis]|uniref:FliM/FliN family flagellar motor switch protein n=1 Tax=Antarctobacter jejuensis TaxID=1439938 RepID=UPI003FD16F7D